MTFAVVALLFAALAAFFLLRCIVVMPDDGVTIRLGGFGGVKTLDPALAEDLTSRNVAGALYDTLLEYDYTARPYRLKNSMLKRPPETDDTGKVWKFELRDDLFFPPEKPGEAAEKVSSHDVKFSFLRLLDTRLHSPVGWILRGKLEGEGDFVRRCEKAAPDDLSMYDDDFPGIRVIDDRRFELHLTWPDVRLKYFLAMPNLGIVSSRFCRRYGNAALAERPAGSGAFVLESWVRNWKLTLKRNPLYRKEFFAEAESAADRGKPLPLAERIELPQIKQTLSAWLLFLQGKLDSFAVDRDFEGALSGGELPEALAERGARMIRSPEFEIRYVGFNFNDKRLGGNPWLRRAMSLAFHPERWRRFHHDMLLPCGQVIPPGVAGYDPDYRNPFFDYNIVLAREYMKKAGYPGGVDPATGEALTLTLDQAGNSVGHRQAGELFAVCMAELGIKIIVNLNNRPRFVEKLRQGKVELFRYSWVGDYPDAENFLQLFYGPNAGKSNRTSYSDPAYDRLFEKLSQLPEGEEKNAICRELNRMVCEDAVWIFEGIPLSGVLVHRHLQNYLPHDFAFVRWKYLALDGKLRREAEKHWRALDFSEMRSRSVRENGEGK